MKKATTNIFDGIEKAHAAPEPAENEAPALAAYLKGEPISAIFNGTYTITNRETGEYRTFRIRTQGEDSSFAPGKRVLSLLTGSDNTTDYTGFAFVHDDGSLFTVWKKKRGTKYDKYAKLVRLVLFQKAPHALEKYEVLEDCRCIRCNRKLTTPESIKSGIGPICAGRL
ncbi:MAG: hypothetical protein GY906_12805 [bacterium]|nr:hypothetical protein [bacterium]